MKIEYKCTKEIQLCTIRNRIPNCTNRTDRPTTAWMNGWTLEIEKKVEVAPGEVSGHTGRKSCNETKLWRRTRGIDDPVNLGPRRITSRSGYESVFPVETAMLFDAAHMDAELLFAMLLEKLPQKIRHLGICKLAPGHLLLVEIADLERFAAGAAAIAFHDSTKDDVDLTDRRQAGDGIEREFLRVDLHTSLFESLAYSRPFEGLPPLHESRRWSPRAQRGLLRPATQQQTVAAGHHQGNQDARVLVTNCVASHAKEPLAGIR